MHLLSLILTFLVGIQARNSPYAKMAIQGSLQFQEIVIRHEISELFWLIHLDVFTLSNKTVIILNSDIVIFFYLIILYELEMKIVTRIGLWIEYHLKIYEIPHLLARKTSRVHLKAHWKWLTNRRWVMHGLLVTKLNTWR